MGSPTSLASAVCEGPYCVPKPEGGIDCSNCPLCTDPFLQDDWNEASWEFDELVGNL